MSRPDPLTLSSGLGIWTFVLGYLAITEGASISWRGLLWVTVLVMIGAGAVGFWLEGKGE